MKNASLCHKNRATRSMSSKGHPRLTWEWLLVVALIALVVGGILFVFKGTAASNPVRSAAATRSHASSSSLTTQSLLAGNVSATQPALPTGIFPATKGGPVPIPANVLTPTNMARIVARNIVTNIYAGFMTRSPQTGALAVLQENLITGQESLHIYQTARPVGALTIRAIQKNGLLLSAAHTPGDGTFDLKTDQFHF